jgi:hypothetical protein
MINQLKQLTNHNYFYITTRGNAAIKAALSLVSGSILIPDEGGWLSYKTLPKKFEIEIIELKCDDSKINLKDLKDKLNSKPTAILYQNPGGYFAQQSMKEIFELCKKNYCLVIMDVSGSIGTELCDGNYADIMVCSFGKGKLVNAHGGGFISCKDKELFDKLLDVDILKDETQIGLIEKKLNDLSARIRFLSVRRNKIIHDLEDLKEFDIVYPKNLGFVVVVKYVKDMEKESLINYCKINNLEWTECPRYIRLNKMAISIEVKRLLS